MIYGYARCSTNEERQDISRQIRELKEKGVEQQNIFFEYESGTKFDRKVWNSLMDLVSKGDIIYSSEVSRITRSTKQLCEIIELAKNRKFKLVLGDFVIDCTKELDPMTEGMLKMMGVFAELERNIITQRVKSGIINAKAKGKILGRPLTTEEDIPSVFYRYYPKFKNKEINKMELSKLCNLSYPTIYKYLKLVEEVKEDDKN